MRPTRQIWLLPVFLWPTLFSLTASWEGPYALGGWNNGFRTCAEWLSADRALDLPTRAQQQADALALLAETALHHTLDPGAPGDRYQVVVHVDAPRTRRSGSAGRIIARARRTRFRRKRLRTGWVSASMWVTPSMSCIRWPRPPCADVSRFTIDKNPADVIPLPVGGAARLEI